MIKQIYSTEFKEKVSNGLVVVDFFATWCQPCKMVSPIIEELDDEMSGKVKFFKVDIDKSLDLANKFKISSVPTLLFFKDGEKIDTIVGFLPKEELKQRIEANI